MLPDNAIIRLFPPYMNEIGTIAGWNQVNVITPFKMDAQP
jgi:hypothetical protein